MRDSRSWLRNEGASGYLARGFPVFDELTNAASALRAIGHHEKFLYGNF